MEEFEVLIYGGERVRETGDEGPRASYIIYHFSCRLRYPNIGPANLQT